MTAFIVALILLAVPVAPAAPVDPSRNRDELIGALREIHRDEGPRLNAGDALEAGAILGQGLYLATTGALAFVSKSPVVRMSPSQRAAVNAYLDWMVKYLPMAALAQGSVMVGAAVIGLSARSNRIFGPIDVRSEEGFAQFLAAPEWRQIEIAVDDPEFEAWLLDYARALREVRDDFKPRKN